MNGAAIRRTGRALGSAVQSTVLTHYGLRLRGGAGQEKARRKPPLPSTIVTRARV
jgi:hypothetical protein